MATQDRDTQRGVAKPQRGRMDWGIVGVILVVIGLVALAANVWNLEFIGLLVLPLLGIVFLAWALWRRRPGFTIPGGILVGLGLGALAQRTLFADASREMRGALVVLGLALGFLAIMPLMQLAGGRFHWWPAIPGLILMGVSFAMMAGSGGVAVLQAVNALWPIALIVAGAYLVWVMYRARGARGRNRRGLPS